MTAVGSLDRLKASTWHSVNSIKTWCEYNIPNNNLETDGAWNSFVKTDQISVRVRLLQTILNQDSTYTKQDIVNLVILVT